MISESTKKAVLALVEIDESATPDEKDAVAAVLRCGVAHVDNRVLSFAEVSKRTGKSKMTVWTWVKTGKLQAVRGGGDRNIGVLESSFEDFIAGKKGKKEETCK